MYLFSYSVKLLFISMLSAATCNTRWNGSQVVAVKINVLVMHAVLQLTPTPKPAQVSKVLQALLAAIAAKAPAEDVKELIRQLQASEPGVAKLAQSSIYTGTWELLWDYSVSITDSQPFLLTMVTQPHTHLLLRRQRKLLLCKRLFLG